ncbi:uncharacterized protein LOC127791052 [Diospyros lotus]|uniref:uncharacterized protein LOC127791052 n=1 Tax=Diospyros lotus TaxID=55363 RepID=UPI0022558C51|nr:uncharacterized protein LOC127791052 [Diospyros lotus]
MDWFSWLSESRLHPCKVYQYGLALYNNELEEDDIAYFNHDFLQSIGVSIAKHRLEILKLAAAATPVRSPARPPRPSNISRLALAVRRARRCLSKCFLVLVPSHGSGSRRKGAALLKKKGRLLLPGGGFSGPLVVRRRCNDGDNDDDDDKTNSSNGVEELFRWDAMFQDLKPT